MMLERIFFNIFTLSVTSIAIISVILFIKHIFRNKLDASWHYLIWFLLLIRLLIPYTPESDMKYINNILHTYNTIDYQKDQSNIQKKPVVIVKVDDKKSVEANIIEGTQAYFNKNTLNGKTPENIKESGADGVKGEDIVQQSIYVLSIIWFIGVILLAFYAFITAIILGRKIKKSSLNLTNYEIISILQECKKLTGIKCEIRIICQSHIKVPALYGVFRPILLLPESITCCFNRSEIKNVVLHELCHYKRKDNFIGMIQLVLNILHWFNPLIWYSSYKISQDREMACDKLVMTYINSNEHRKYVETLIKTLEVFSKNYWLPNIVGMTQGRMSNIERRLKMITPIKRKSMLLCLTITIAIILLGGFGTLIINDKINFIKPLAVNNAVTGKMDSLNSKNILDRNGISLVVRNSHGKSKYPFGNLASHVIGFRDDKGKGVLGVENVLDKYPADLAGITLTIDEKIQEMTDNVLDNAIKEYKAKGACAIVIDPKTGEILSMSSKPDFNPNDPLRIPKGMDQAQWDRLPDNDKVDLLKENVFKNKAISICVPASTFKTITAAMCLEEGLIKPDSMVNDSPVTIDGMNINCWSADNHGNETFTDAVCNSCNPVFVKLAQNLGMDRFYKYVNEFGFYDKTNMGLPGEQQGIFSANPSKLDMMAACIGDRIEITPLQLISAYTAIANGGNLMQPLIIKNIIGSDGKIKEFKPQILKNMISKQTSDELKTILEDSIAKGTGINAYMEGYGIAGKTGTSEMLQGINYSNNASFVGFAPVNEPKIACIIVLEEPGTETYTGGTTAAPACGKLMKEVLDYITQ